MRLVIVDELTPGMVMARAIYDDNYRLLVSKGVALDAKLIARLKKQEFFQVYIEEAGTEDVIPSDMITDQTRTQATRILNRTFTKVTTASEIKDASIEDIHTLLDKGTQYRHLVSIPDVRSIIKNILDDLIDNNVSMFESPLFRGYMGQRYEHALNTAILSVLIGRQYRFDRKELNVLAMAGLLHDVGKMLFPDVLEKHPDQYTDEDVEKMKEHPAFGAKLLDKIPQASYAEVASVEQHHERQDGKGYPKGYFGTNTEPIRTRPKEKGRIFRAAEILAVANTYDNLLDPSMTNPPLTPVEAVERLINLGGTVLNSHVVASAVNSVNVFPVGATVRVRSNLVVEVDGASAVVFKANEGALDHPWIILLHDAKGNRFRDKITINLMEKKGIQISLN